MKLQNKKTPLKFKFFGILMLFGLIILTGCKKLQMPKVTTTPITNLINNGIVIGGNITFDGGTSITKRGMCWGTNLNPTIENNTGFTQVYGPEQYISLTDKKGNSYPTRTIQTTEVPTATNITINDYNNIIGGAVPFLPNR